MPFCTHCGLEYQQPANFCNRCGRALPVAAVRAAVEERAVAAAMPLELPYYLSLKRIILVTVLSFGLFYLLYWFYLTWKHYRDHTGNEAYPVWHALAMLVPIYGFFRAYAHARAYQDLMREAGISGSIKAWLVVILLLTPTPFHIVGYIALCWHLQSNINRYWHSLPNVQVTSAPVGVGEVIAGASYWLLLLVVLFL